MSNLYTGDIEVVKKDYESEINFWIGIDCHFCVGFQLAFV